ncbi:MAG: AAA family ATPase [Verrucomicrobiota bacterium]
MHAQCAALVSQISEIIVGKESAIRLAIACILARGHLLIEDLPGVGKTILSQALASTLGLHFRRIQFTSDLLPADVLGNSIYNREEQRFIFLPGPIFSQVALIDEVNRATPKTQSALLESMEENQVTIDGSSHPLPSPFFVIATQNPQHQIGTFPLPESQLDRFLMRIELGVPNRAAERLMLLGADRREMLRSLAPITNASSLLELQSRVRQIHTSPALLDYLQDLLEASRLRYPPGLSPRAALGLLHAAQSWAFIEGREMVLPEDIQAVAPSVITHRLGNTHSNTESRRALVESLLREVPVP